MNVAGGKVSIKNSTAAWAGGSGGVGRFLGHRTGHEGFPPRSGTQSVIGSAALGRRVLRVQGVRSLQADATPAVTQPVIFFKSNVCVLFRPVHFFARANLATAL